MLRSRGESPTILATLVASLNLEVDDYPLEFRHKLFSLIFEHIELREKQRTEHLSILCIFVSLSARTYQSSSNHIRFNFCYLQASQYDATVHALNAL